ncbi:hypothetical protein DPEC_G00270490 [Dallia pectoralis]|uniref:Uncharacterized protein n=1 Tax=Dallia pectoralis TaxID=75939 RepID=A0ACC2FPB0_DALPE|nr:hypothetical protein DPEC_G00270490 [Dallia pectoralis]
MPNRLKALDKDRAAKPLHPTSIGRHHALHPACRHPLTSPSYLASFLSKAFSRRSSQGTVSSNRTTCLLASEKRTTSGLKVVVSMWLGNLSCCSRSTNSCQSLAVARRPADVFAAGFGCSPALMKVMACLDGLAQEGEQTVVTTTAHSIITTTNSGTNSTANNSGVTTSKGKQPNPFNVDSSTIRRALYVLIGVTTIGMFYFLVRAVRLKKTTTSRKKYGLLSNYDDSVEMAALESDEEDDTVYEARSLRR